MKKIRFFLLSIFSLILFGFSYSIAKKSSLKVIEPSDQSQQWEKHIIKSGIKRDHGHTTAIGDINGDGRTDALICWGWRNIAKESDAVYWYKCPSDPRNAEEWQQYRITPNKEGMHPRWGWAVGVGDVDNDGDSDVVVDDFDDGRILLSINPLKQGGDVEKPWQTIEIVSGGSRYGQRIEITDVDGDGWKDIVYLKWFPNEVCILWNPRLQPDDPTVHWERKVIGAHGGSDTYDVYTGDMDNDLDLDIITASGESNAGGIYWFEYPDNNPRGEWKCHTVWTHDYCLGALQIYDVNSDGWRDIIACETHSHPGEVYWFKNPKKYDTQWTRYIIGTQTYPSASCLIDVDGDGRAELYVPDASNGTDGTKFKWGDGGLVYFKIPSDPIKQWTKYFVAKPPERGRRTKAIDIDHDGDLDLVSTGNHNCISDFNQCTISLVWWENKTPRAKN